MRLSKEKLSEIVKEEVSLFLHEQVKIESYSEEDNQKIKDFLNKNNVDFSQDGSIFTINIKRDNEEGSQILSQLGAAADFEALDKDMSEGKISKRELNKIINEEIVTMLSERSSKFLDDPKLKKMVDKLGRKQDQSYVKKVKDKVIDYIQNSNINKSDKKKITKTVKKQRSAMDLLQYIYNSILAYDDLRVSKGEMPLAR